MVGYPVEETTVAQPVAGTMIIQRFPLPPESHHRQKQRVSPVRHRRALSLLSSKGWHNLRQRIVSKKIA
jgi:hypothetical protein